MLELATRGKIMRTLPPGVSAVRSLLASTALLVGVAPPISATQMLGPQIQVSVSTHGYSSFRIAGVKVTPTNNPSGERRRVTV
jgi:hypothetical protein